MLARLVRNLGDFVALLWPGPSRQANIRPCCMSARNVSQMTGSPTILETEAVGLSWPR